MPRVGEPTNRDIKIISAVQEIDAFVNATAWKRSARGNWYCEWEGKTLTVFSREGMFRWCIVDADGKRFSRQDYEEENDAKVALAEELGIGESLGGGEGEWE